jgi:hypothetical protein
MQGSKKIKFTQHSDVIIAGICTSVLAILVLNYNIIETHDGLAHLMLVHYWNEQILEGQLYPKWFEDALGGLGTLSFTFYNPIVRICSTPFGLLSLAPTAQLKGSLIILLLLNTVGVIKLTRMLFTKHSLGSIVSIFTGILNPYLITNFIYRGAFTEAFGIAIIPWIAIGTYLALSDSKVPRFFPLTLAFTALFLAHVPLSLMFVSCFLLSVAILLIFRKIGWQDALISLLLPVCLALMIDAFFVLPIVFDVNLIHQAGGEFIENEFLLNIILNFSEEEVPNRWWHISLLKPFLIHFLILIVSVLVIQPFNSKEIKQVWLFQQIVLIAFSLLMMTDLSLWIYDILPIFRKIQFPWRFLAITSSLTPYLLGYSLECLKRKYLFLSNKIAILLVISILIPATYESAILNLEGLSFTQENLNTIDYLLFHKNYIPTEILQRAPHKKVGKYYLFEFGGPSPIKFYMAPDQTLFQGEITAFLPKTVPIQSQLLDPEKYTNPVPRIEIVRGQGNFTIEDWYPGKRHLTVEATTEIVLNLKTFFYPGWKVEATPFPANLERENLFVSAPDGRMQLKLPSGTYDIKIVYRGTLAERIGTAVSLATVSLLIFPGLKFKFKHTRQLLRKRGEGRN